MLGSFFCYPLLTTCRIADTINAYKTTPSGKKAKIMTTAQATPKAAHCFGQFDFIHTVVVGSVLLPDNWHEAVDLKAPHFEPSEFGVQSWSTGAWSSVNIKITGRTSQRRSGDYWVRCSIEFVQDGEPSIMHAGWLKMDSLKCEYK